ncbi:hypothetical protein SCHPADRAFT_404983 [Schizopora paradoxa]|uniref:Uncharacterized protein n=1 Tax=Schizopora paradoxa TaxID=27342 RepID=A0A0H2RT70_9AGAM|nr:hypothetical protein SCHPADRAFT_404983 [Schizopora paradoxa]
MTNVLTSYMQNVSISLLSGSVGINDSASDTSQNLIFVNSSCVSSWDAYVYSPTRLLSTYGVAFILALCIAIPGISLILRNGVEEKIVISHIIQSALNPQFFNTSKDTVEMTQARTIRRISGHSNNASHTQIGITLEYDIHGTNIGYMSSSNSLSRFVSISSFQTRLQASKSQMVIFTLGGILCMVIHHLFCSFLDARSLNSPISHPRWITKQRVVSDIGIAIAYAGQVCLAAAIAISSQQLFWNILRRRAHTISQIDSLMRMQQNPFSTSLFRCTQASLALIVAAFISASLPIISTFAPNSIKLSFDHIKSAECTVRTPRKLTTLHTTNVSDYSVPINSVFMSGSYSSPANLCNADLGLQCSYNIDFFGPGLHCSDVTTSKNFTAFKDANLLGHGPKPPEALNVWLSSIAGDDKNRTLRLSVQTWDPEESVFQALDCAGVIRSYSSVVTHGSSSTIEVTRSDVLSPVLVDPGSNLSISSMDSNTITPSNVSFTQQYLFYTMEMVQGEFAIGVGFKAFNVQGLFHMPNILSSSTAEQTVSWNKNMDQILEQFAQNATLSLLSGQIFLLNSGDGQDILEDFTTTCDYVITAYEYSPSRLFATYGIAIALTILCAIGGVYAIRRNGFDESMDFSRFLRAVSNERMFNSRERIEMETAIKADNDVDGSFAPFLESKM